LGGVTLATHITRSAFNCIRYTQEGEQLTQKKIPLHICDFGGPS